MGRVTLPPLSDVCFPGLRARARRWVRPVRAHVGPSAPCQSAYWEAIDQ